MRRNLCSTGSQLQAPSVSVGKHACTSWKGKGNRVTCVHGSVFHRSNTLHNKKKTAKCVIIIEKYSCHLDRVHIACTLDPGYLVGSYPLRVIQIVAGIPALSALARL